MNPITIRSLISVLIALASLQALSTADWWPQFRGPQGNGIANDAATPVEFGENQNVSWRTELPGRGWSSPVVVDDVIWVTAGVEQVSTENERLAALRAPNLASGQAARLAKVLTVAKSIELKLISIDLQSGSTLRTIDLVTVDAPDPIHPLNTYASPTAVIDGNQIYCHFGTNGTFCVNRSSGQTLWQRRLRSLHNVGAGSSPFIHNDLLVLIQDGVERQYVTALNKRTGASVWERDRPEIVGGTDTDFKKAFSTPVAVTDKRGRAQLICLGPNWLVSYDPQSGKEIWRCRYGLGYSNIAQPVCANDVVYFSTGYNKPELWAVRVDGQGDVSETHVEWTVKKGIPARSSPIFVDGLIYMIDDMGVASCIEASHGHVVWKKRIGGSYSASPVLAGGHLYFAAHEGKVTVIKPGRKPNIVVENQLDGRILASPAVVAGTLILRTDKAIYRIE